MDKKIVYEDLVQQIEIMFGGETNLIAKMSTLCALLKHNFNFLWVGFYIVDEQKMNQLVIGPFQGHLVKFRINYNQTIIGKCWYSQKSLIVDNTIDVNSDMEIEESAFNAPYSEIAVPMFNGKKLVSVLNIRSSTLSNFDDFDRLYLEKIIKLIS